jgi:glutamate-1-semialdehyde aminotransferase
VRNYRDIASGNARLREQVFLGLMNEGVLVAPNLVGALSTAITEAEVKVFVDIFRRVLERQR